MTLTLKTPPQHRKTHTHTPTSERAGCPPPAPVGPLEHTDRPQSRQWSQPSGTIDLSVRQNMFSSLNICKKKKII